MVADDLATQVTRASAAMILTTLNKTPTCFELLFSLTLTCGPQQPKLFLYEPLYENESDANLPVPL